MTHFRELLQLLSASRVEFIVVGGVAAFAHGAFLDLLGEITAGGTYEDLLPHTRLIDVYQTPCRCLELEELIRVKRAVGRPKDFEAVAELETIRDERGSKS